MKRTLFLWLAALSLPLYGAIWQNAGPQGFGFPEHHAVERTAKKGIFLYMGAYARGNSSEYARVFQGAFGTKRWVDVSPTSASMTNLSNDHDWKQAKRILGLVNFGDHLYVGNELGDIWSYDRNMTWKREHSGSPRHSGGVNDMVVYEKGGRKHLIVAYGDPVGIYEVVRGRRGTRLSPFMKRDGGGNMTSGFGRNASDSHFARLGTFAGRLYLGLGRQSPGAPGRDSSASQIWEYKNGWKKIADKGFGDNKNGAILSIVGMGSHIYVGTHNNGNQGAQIHRALIGSPEWKNVTPAAWTSRTIVHAHTMEVIGTGGLMVGTRDGLGASVWYGNGDLGNRRNWSQYGNLSTRPEPITSLSFRHPWVYLTLWNTESGVELFRHRLPF